MVSDCQDEFSSKTDMESKGWVFGWNDESVFRPEGNYCNNIPLTSYCGFQFPGDGEISYKFPNSGTGNFSYGLSYNFGSVHVYLNNEELDSRNTPGTSSLQIIFSAGDTLRIKELEESVINIHSLCTSFIGPYPKVFIIVYFNYEKKIEYYQLYPSNNIRLFFIFSQCNS